MNDPNFDRTVILVLEHNSEGALGLVLNRRLDVLLRDALPQWAGYATEPAALFAGGPVSRESAIALAATSVGASNAHWRELVDGIGTLDLSADSVLAGIGVDELRVFSGYSGWGANQLADEIDSGVWFTFDAEPDDLLTTEPDRLWGRVIARQPDDPWRNAHASPPWLN